MNAEIMKLNNGVELPYYEFGKENEEVMMVGQFYFATFMPWLNALGKHFHVYAVTMRTNEPYTLMLPDGRVDWVTIWYNEFLEFADKKGVDKFFYAGKCHGTQPGWEMVRRCPERLKGFIPLSLLPANRDPQKNFMFSEKFRSIWSLLPTDTPKFVSLLLRNQDLIQTKVDEIKTADISGALKGESSALTDIPTNEDLMKFYENINIPVLLQYGMEDPGFQLEWFWETVQRIPRLEVILYQGERHFYEMDIPEKLAYDAICWAKRLKEQGE